MIISCEIYLRQLFKHNYILNLSNFHILEKEYIKDNSEKELQVGIGKGAGVDRKQFDFFNNTDYLLYCN